jgi:hypothetical protein
MMSWYRGMIGVVAVREEDEEDDGQPGGDENEWAFLELVQIGRRSRHAGIISEKYESSALLALIRWA